MHCAWLLAVAITQDSTVVIDSIERGFVQFVSVFVGDRNVDTLFALGVGDIEVLTIFQVSIDDFFTERLLSFKIAVRSNIDAGKEILSSRDFVDELVIQRIVSVDRVDLEGRSDPVLRDNTFARSKGLEPLTF